MAYKEISQETLQTLSKIFEGLGIPPGSPFHIQQQRICDHCHDQIKEAFPYYAIDSDGRVWEHLCNDCFDLLECELDDYWNEDALT